MFVILYNVYTQKNAKFTMIAQFTLFYETLKNFFKKYIISLNYTNTNKT